MNKIGLFLITVFTLATTCSARNIFCKICLWGADLYIKFLKSDYMVNRHLEEDYKTCMETYNKEEYCIGNRDNVAIHEYKAKLSYYNSEEICTEYGFCKDFKYVKDPVKSHAGRLLQNAPPAVEYEGLALGKEKPIRFIVVSDIHMDLGYAEVILNFTFRV